MIIGQKIVRFDKNSYVDIGLIYIPKVWKIIYSLQKLFEQII